MAQCARLLFENRLRHNEPSVHMRIPIPTAQILWRQEQRGRWYCDGCAYPLYYIDNIQKNRAIKVTAILDICFNIVPSYAALVHNLVGTYARWETATSTAHFRSPD